MPYFQDYLDQIQSPTGEFRRILEFFLMFSRFEFALKQSHFVSGGTTSAKANWDSFADTIENGCTDEEKRALYEAGAPILAAPPAKQVLNASRNLDWLFDTSPQSIKTLFIYIRRVRNNLFHGGKFATTPILDPARNGLLIEACIKCLDEAMKLAPAARVKSAYESEIFG